MPTLPEWPVKPSPRPRRPGRLKNSPVELADAEAEYRGVGIEDQRSCL